MRKYLEDQLDAIDASVFSGDEFFDAENRKEFRRLIERWEKELKSFDKMDSEIHSQNNNTENIMNIDREHIKQWQANALPVPSAERLKGRHRQTKRVTL